MSLAAEDYTRELGPELSAVGIGGGLQRRILDEIADHLWCDPDAELGDPRELARQFADELGTERARRAAYSCFTALAAAGTLFAVAFALAPGKLLAEAAGGRVGSPGWLAAVLAVLAPQVALAGGALALIRAWRRRHEPVVTAAEARIVRRRCGVGLLAGVVAMAAVGVMALVLHHHTAAWWVTLTEVSAVAGICLLLSSARSLLAATALAPRVPGGAGDLFDDVGPWLPEWLRGRPWRVAAGLAGALAILITAVGVLQSDPFDGALRGLVDAAGCLAGFVVLGPFLGLRSPGRGRRRA